MSSLSTERIVSLVRMVRGEKVLFDIDLAPLYGVPAKALNQAVKRNISRFPADFMFQLTVEEVRRAIASRSQTVTLKRGHNIKYLPYAFTEQGVAMLSSVLRSSRAVEVNIAIMRTRSDTTSSSLSSLRPLNGSSRKITPAKHSPSAP